MYWILFKDKCVIKSVGSPTKSLAVDMVEMTRYDGDMDIWGHDLLLYEDTSTKTWVNPGISW